MGSCFQSLVSCRLSYFLRSLICRISRVKMSEPQQVLSSMRFKHMKHDRYCWGTPLEKLMGTRKKNREIISKDFLRPVDVTIRFKFHGFGILLFLKFAICTNVHFCNVRKFMY